VLTNLPPSCADYLDFLGVSTSCGPKVCPRLYRDSLTFGGKALWKSYVINFPSL
jgi:hypothetical protein